MLLLQVLSSASGSSTDSLGHGEHPSSVSLSFSSSSSSSGASSPPTTPATGLSSNASVLENDDDLFTPSSIMVPAPPPSLSSSDDRLPVSSSPSATIMSEASSASISSSTSSSPISLADSIAYTQLLSSVSSRSGDRTTELLERKARLEVMIPKIEKLEELWGGIEEGMMEVQEMFRNGESSLAVRIERVEVSIQKGEKAKELTDSIMEDVERLSESPLAGQMAGQGTTIKRKSLLAEVKLRRLKTMLKREARANGETRTAPDTVAADRHLVDSGRLLALGGRDGEVDDGRARADRTSEWLKGLPRFG